MFTRAVQTMVLAMLVAGCMDDGAPTGVSSSPAAIAIVSGDAQAGTVDQALVNLLVVRVSDLRGRPVRNTLVQFEVVAGAGTIVARSDGLTDSVGMARLNGDLARRRLRSRRHARACSNKPRTRPPSK